MTDTRAHLHTAAALAASIPPSKIWPNSERAHNQAQTPWATGTPSIPSLPDLAANSLIFTITTVARDGRIADSSPLRRLGWRPGTDLSMSAYPDAGAILLRRGGHHTVTKHGHIILPYNLRRRLNLQAPQQLLAASFDIDNVLILYTPDTLESMLLRHHTEDGHPPSHPKQ